MVTPERTASVVSPPRDPMADIPPIWVYAMTRFDDDEEADIMELFCGTEPFAKEAEKQGWKVLKMPNQKGADIIYGHDLRSDKTQRQILEAIARKKVKFVMIQIKCDDFSQLLNLVPGLAEQRLQMAYPLARFVKNVCGTQHFATPKRKFVIENPASSRLWSTDQLQEVLSWDGVFDVNFPMDGGGLKNPVTGALWHKNTKNVTNSETVAQRVAALKCPGGPHEPNFGLNAVPG